MEVPVIAVVGSLNMDLVVRAPRQPLLGETLMGSSFGTAGGGKGSNQALACARLGADVYMVGCVGSDDFGRRLRSTLLEAKVDCQYMEVCAGVGTGVAVITVTDSGENSIVLTSGANALLDRATLERSKEVFRRSDTALFQLETPLDTVAWGLKMARNSGCKTVLTPAPAVELPQEIWRQVDFLVLNETELAFYSLGPSFASAGAPSGMDEDKLQESAQQLLQQGVKTVVVTRGARGGYVASRQKAFHFEPFRVHSVDSTGAGDSFCAALSVKLTEGALLEEAVEFAAAAGALACTRMVPIPPCLGGTR